MTISEALQILELKAPISGDDIERAFQDALAIWNPDHFEGKPDIRAKAEVRASRIHEAYSMLISLPESDHPFESKELSNSETPCSPSFLPPPSSQPVPNVSGSAFRGANSTSARAVIPSGKSRRPFPLLKTAVYAAALGLIGALVAINKEAIIQVVDRLAPKTRHAWRQIAALYDMQAQLELAKAYDEGIGVPKDATKAFKWYWEAAQQNSAEAQCYLGNAYSEGFGVPKDEVEAVKWWEMAAEQDHADAQFQLANAYHGGFGLSKNDVEAVKWYRLAAMQHHANAQYEFGYACLEGIGVPKDEVEAMKWYRKAAEQNNAEAQVELGSAYVQGIGVPKDAVEAVKWYRLAAAQDSAEAQYLLGSAFHGGIGVPKDDVEAVKWYRKAALQNHADAQLNFGYAYARGIGVPKDDVEAMKWCKKAAEQDNANAQFEFGKACEYGDGGITKSLEMATAWYKKAAAQGHLGAEKQLADITANAQSLATREKEVSIAELDAQKRLRVLEQQLAVTQEMIAETQRIALENAELKNQEPAMPFNPDLGDPALKSQVTKESLGRVFIPGKGWLAVGPNGPIDIGSRQVVSRVRTRSEVREREIAKSAERAGMSVDNYLQSLDQQKLNYQLMSLEGQIRALNNTIMDK
jgi:TPR repeat protein